MELVVIASVSKNNVIGNNGKIPWKIPEDLERFRKFTLNSPVIMGRKTFESIGEPLDKRVNIVLTRKKNYKPEDVITCHSFVEALGKCKIYDKAFIIGGETVYKLAMPVADRMEITWVNRNPKGDAFFPSIDSEKWAEKKRIDKKRHSFVTYVRK